MDSSCTPNRRVVAVLEVMWDWQGATTSAGYKQAPEWFRIDPHNYTGRRLYNWLGKRRVDYDELLVTDACKELVSNAHEKGTPDKDWLSTNLQQLKPFSLILVCGKVAQATVNLTDTVGSRCLFVPHPAARQWTAKQLAYVGRLIREGRADLHVQFKPGRLSVTSLVPF